MPGLKASIWAPKSTPTHSGPTYPNGPINKATSTHQSSHTAMMQFKIRGPQGVKQLTAKASVTWSELKHEIFNKVGVPDFGLGYGNPPQLFDKDSIRRDTKLPDLRFKLEGEQLVVFPLSLPAVSSNPMSSGRAPVRSTANDTSGRVPDIGSSRPQLLAGRSSIALAMESFHLRLDEIAYQSKVMMESQREIDHELTRLQYQRSEDEVRHRRDEESAAEMRAEAARQLVALTEQRRNLQRSQQPICTICQQPASTSDNEPAQALSSDGGIVCSDCISQSFVCHGRLQSTGTYGIPEPITDICTLCWHSPGTSSNGPARVVDLCDDVFCHDCICQWFDTHDTCPNCGCPADHSAVRPPGSEVSSPTDSSDARVPEPAVDNCTICQEAPGSSDNGPTITLQCTHVCCNACIVPWYEEHGTCPNCRCYVVPPSVPPPEPSAGPEPAVDNCTICQEAPGSSGNGALYTMPCTHVFCYDCIAPWHRAHGTCPNCRVRD